MFNESFHKNLESIQCKAAIVITGAIRVTSSGKLFQELGLESLKSKSLKTLAKKTVYFLKKITLLSLSAHSFKQWCLCYKKFSKQLNSKF